MLQSDACVWFSLCEMKGVDVRMGCPWNIDVLCDAQVQSQYSTTSQLLKLATNAIREARRGAFADHSNAVL